ncbi:ArgK/MeaB family GTPase [Coralliovum pocilloporae]|uniref:ArgK/MeaB family GTPase n=1 Tax=Coralliovum pocilloporae TaxID=3066369 RepID=UPI003306AF9D
MTIPTLDDLRNGGKPAMSRALTAVEIHQGTNELATLLDEAAKNPRGFVLGLTGPPGVGKSTLTNALLRAWRSDGLSVGVLAVDPSSRFTRGALLGDRTRLKTDPEDRQVFVRSMAARDRLGGLSDHAVAGIVLMRAVYDRVIVESVGIGQSEADIAFAADGVALCIQPGSGDSLQFMKAGVMELPDLICVTKADMEAEARRARADVEGALTLNGPDRDWTAPVIMVSAMRGDGLDDLVSAVNRYEAYLHEDNRLASLRQAQERFWVEDVIRSQFGRAGLSQADIPDALGQNPGPFSTMLSLSRTLADRFQ